MRFHFCILLTIKYRASQSCLNKRRWWFKRVMNLSVGTTRLVRASSSLSTTTTNPNSWNSLIRVRVARSVIRPFSNFKDCGFPSASVSKVAAIMKYKSLAEIVCNSRPWWTSHRLISISICYKLGSLTPCCSGDCTNTLAYFVYQAQNVCTMG